MKLSNIVFALIALLLVGAIFYADSNLRALARGNAQRDLVARARFLADSTDRFLQARMVQTLTFAALPSLRGFTASDQASRAQRAAIAQNELQAIVAADPNVRAATILDPDGIVVLTTDNTMQAIWSERLFFREALRGQLHASVPAKDFGEVSQYYSAPLIDNAGKVGGVLVIRVAVQELWEMLGTEGSLLLVDENGVVIADTSTKPQTFTALAPITGETYNRLIAEKQYGAEAGAIRFSNQTTLAGLIKVDNAGVFAFSDSNTRPTLGAARRLQTKQWRVVVLQTEDTVVAPARDALMETFKFGAVLFLAGVGFMFAFSRAVKRRS